jgi:hypothetical protein
MATSGDFEMAIDIQVSASQGDAQTLRRLHRRHARARLR